MQPFNLLTPLERKLSAFLRLLPDPNQPHSWLLDVQLFYESRPAGRTRFNLHGYSQSEAEEIARNLKDNAYLMREIDEYLWGESD